MRIGLLDLDSHNMPNIPLMKISAWHKAQGDQVEMFNGLLEYDKVYVNKIFSFTEDYIYPIKAKEVIYGGSGYCIKTKDGKEWYDTSIDKPLPDEIEHIYPDYSLYPQFNSAYGVLTRGCPRACAFCHTGAKDGLISRKVADVNEFWKGQKNIVLLDQNLLACKDWKELIQQLIETKAWVDFDGGTDIRMITREKAEMLSQLKVKEWHFAWDRYEDKEIIIPKLKLFNEYNKCSWKNSIVYTLVNYDTTIEQDLERIQILKELGYSAYVMIYNRESLPKGDIHRKLQRWVNNRFIFYSCDSFNDYLEQN